MANQGCCPPRPLDVRYARLSTSNIAYRPIYVEGVLQNETAPIDLKSGLSVVFNGTTGRLEISAAGGGGGSIDWKDSVTVATATALPASTRVNNVRTANAVGAFPTVDGVALVLGDSILDKDHATGADRGLWTLTNAGSAGTAWVLTRRSDADASSEVTNGMRVPVALGTANGGKVFKLTTADPITLNTTALTFEQDGGGGSGGHVIESNGTPLTQRANINVTGLLQASDSGSKTLLHLPNINLASQVTGTLPAASVGAGFLKADGSVALSANWAAGSFRITGLANGSAASQDAATVAQVEALLAAAVSTLADWKQSVRAATTASITLSGAQTIDGVSVIAGDRVLVKNQGTASQNGIYVCAAGAWSRSTDADASAEVTSGLTVAVEEGTANGPTGTGGGNVFMLTTANPITVGSTSLTFTRIGTSVPDGVSIELNAGSLRRAALGGDVTAPAGSNTTTIANNAVTTAKIADAQVTAAKLSSLSITDIPPVACATTGNITLSGEQTIDGVLTSGSRVLVWNQTTGSQNGVYVSAAGAWTRATDFDASADFRPGVMFVVAGGTLYGGRIATLITTGTITVGTTTPVFVVSAFPVAPAQGGVLGDAAVTKNISDGTQFRMPAGTTTTARAITVGTSGTPELYETIEFLIFAQGHTVTIVNGGPLGGTIWTIASGTKRGVMVQWNGTDWVAAGKIRLA